jgi:hypothetical protein
MSTRYENSATAKNAGAGMDLINTIFKVKSNKLASMERYNQRTNKTIKMPRSSMISEMQNCREHPTSGTKNAPEFLARKLNIIQIL